MSFFDRGTRAPEVTIFERIGKRMDPIGFDREPAQQIEVVQHVSAEELKRWTEAQQLRKDKKL